jgi:hypothetical protein
MVLQELLLQSVRSDLDSYILYQVIRSLQYLLSVNDATLRPFLVRIVGTSCTLLHPQALLSFHLHLHRWTLTLEEGLLTCGNLGLCKFVFGEVQSYLV